MTSFPKQATPPVSHLCSCPPTAQLQLPFLANHHQPKSSCPLLLRHFGHVPTAHLTPTWPPCHATTTTRFLSCLLFSLPCQDKDQTNPRVPFPLVSCRSRNPPVVPPWLEEEEDGFRSTCPWPPRGRRLASGGRGRGRTGAPCPRSMPSWARCSPTSPSTG